MELKTLRIAQAHHPKMQSISNRGCSARPQGLSHASTFPTVLGLPAPANGIVQSSQLDPAAFRESGARLGICDSRSLQQAAACPARRRRVARRSVLTSAASGSVTETSELRLIHPAYPPGPAPNLLVFLPGTDGTGQAILPQLGALHAAGYDVWCLNMPPTNRANWSQLTVTTSALVQRLLDQHQRQQQLQGDGISSNGTSTGAGQNGAGRNGHQSRKITVVGESFGAVLGMRLALRSPHLVERLVLINPATCFNQSLSGLSSLVSSTNLLSLFPQPLYQAAQTAMLPLLVEPSRLSVEGTRLMRYMIEMRAAGPALGSEPVTLTSPIPASAPPQPPGSNGHGPPKALVEQASAHSTKPLSPQQSTPKGALPSKTTSSPPAPAALLPPPPRPKALPPPSGSSAWLQENQLKQQAQQYQQYQQQQNRARSTSPSRSFLPPFPVPWSGTLPPVPTSPQDFPTFFMPAEAAAAANFRASLLRDGGDLKDEELKRVTCPVLIISSARDRLLPSIQEGGRLQRAIPGATRVILPDSGHAPLLETGVDLAALMQAIPNQARQGVLAAAKAVQGESTQVGSNAVQSARREKAGRQADKAGEVASPTAATQQASDAVQAVGAQQAGHGTTAEGGVMAGSLGMVAVKSSMPPQDLDSAVTGGDNDVSSSNGASNGNGASAAAARLERRKRLQTVAAAAIKAANERSEQEVRQERQRQLRRKAASVAPWDIQGQLQERFAALPWNQEYKGDTADAFDEWSQILGPWRDIVSPVVVGAEHLPALGSEAAGRPMLLVGNHQRVGLYDTPLLVYELAVRGYRVRGLAHPKHWSGPLGPWFERFGAVKASPMAAFRLLNNNEKVLLFPGGAREVVKSKDSNYTLFWKDEPDFVRLAVKCKALIVPFAAVGADDAYDIMMDTQEVINHPVLGPLARETLKRIDPEIEMEEAVMPLTRLPGLGLPTPIPIPNLQRLYFKIAPPLDTAAMKLSVRDEAGMQELYTQVKHTVEQCMGDLLVLRAADDEAQVGGRVRKALNRWSALMRFAGPGPHPSDEYQEQRQLLGSEWMTRK